MTSPTTSGPPSAPSVHPVIRFTSRQRIGLPLLFAIPILALFGAFGERTTTVEGRGATLGVLMRYPSSIHYGQTMSMLLTIRNFSPFPTDTVVVTVDPVYLQAFRAIRFTPPDARQVGAVVLPPVPPGGVRLVTADLTGEDWGRHQGGVTIQVRGDSMQPPIRVPLSTIVFP